LKGVPLGPPFSFLADGASYVQNTGYPIVRGHTGVAPQALATKRLIVLTRSGGL
jgi:hypothetical protein